MVKSKIFLSEFVENKDRKFGEAIGWYPTMIVYPNGSSAPGFLTKADVDKLRERASRNPEDVPVYRSKGPATMWEFIFGRPGS